MLNPFPAKFISTIFLPIAVIQKRPSLIRDATPPFNPLFKAVPEAQLRATKILHIGFFIDTFPTPVPKKSCATRIAIRVLDIPKTTPNNSLGIQP